MASYLRCAPPYLYSGISFYPESAQAQADVLTMKTPADVLVRVAIAAVLLASMLAVPFGIAMGSWPGLVISVVGIFSLIVVTLLRLRHVRRVTAVYSALLPDFWPSDRTEIDREARQWITSRVPTRMLSGMICAGISVEAAVNPESLALSQDDLAVMGQLRDSSPISSS